MRDEYEDTLITLSCNAELPLEERVELLAYAFAKFVQGSVLRRVVDWDIKNGKIRFIIGQIWPRDAPRGSINARIEEPKPEELGVSVEFRRLGCGEGGDTK